MMARSKAPHVVHVVNRVTLNTRQVQQLAADAAICAAATFIHVPPFERQARQASQRILALLKFMNFRRTR